MSEFSEDAFAAFEALSRKYRERTLAEFLEASDNFVSNPSAVHYTALLERAVDFQNAEKDNGL